MQFPIKYLGSRNFMKNFKHFCFPSTLIRAGAAAQGPLVDHNECSTGQKYLFSLFFSLHPAALQHPRATTPAPSKRPADQMLSVPLSTVTQSAHALQVSQGSPGTGTLTRLTDVSEHPLGARQLEIVAAVL